MRHAGWLRKTVQSFTSKFCTYNLQICVIFHQNSLIDKRGQEKLDAGDVLYQNYFHDGGKVLLQN